MRWGGIHPSPNRQPRPSPPGLLRQRLDRDRGRGIVQRGRNLSRNRQPAAQNERNRRTRQNRKNEDDSTHGRDSR